MSSIQTSAISGLTTAQIANLPNAEIFALSASQLQAMSTTQIARLTTAQISYFNTNTTNIGTLGSNVASVLFGATNLATIKSNNTVLAGSWN